MKKIAKERRRWKSKEKGRGGDWRREQERRREGER